MAGLLDWLSPALTVGTQAAGAHEQGLADKRKAQQADALQTMQMLRQAQEAQDRRVLQAAQTGHLNAQTDALKNPKPEGLRIVPQGSVMVDPQGRQIFTNPKPETDRNPVIGSPEWKDAERFKASLIPRDDKTLVLTQNDADPSGPGVYTPRGQAIGKAAPAKPKAENAMQIAANARLQAAVGEMTNAHNGMEEYETALKNRTTSINGLQQFLGAVGNSFTHDDPASRAVQSAALAALNNTNPELARYIRRGLSFAEGESMVSQRPSDFRTKMAAFLSTAASGASPEMIGDIESRRTSILNPLHETVGYPGAKSAPGGRAGGSGASKAAGATPTRAQALWDAAVAKHGRAKVEAEYGPRPE